MENSSQKGSHASQKESDSIEKFTNDADAYAPAVVANQDVTFTEEQEKRLRRKIDWYVIPTVAIIYMFCFIDRANIGNARLAGLERDLRMTGRYDFNILLSAFYVAYIVFELPSNLLCKKIGPGKWLPFLTVSFGLLSLCTAFVESFGSAIAVRFLLGVAEAGHLPGIAYYLSRWYRRDELAFRLSMYIVCAPLAGAFGGLLASGILRIDSIGYLTAWRNIFLVEGIITVGLGIISFFTLTDRIETARWLSVEEKRIAIARMQADNSHTVTEIVDKLRSKQVLAGIFNVTSVTMALSFMLDNISVQGVAFFLPTIVRTLFPGRSTIQLQLLTVPPYVVGAVFVLLLPYLSMKFHHRGGFLIFSGCLMVLGYAMYVGTNVTDSNARYAASFFVAMGAFPMGAFMPGWASANQNTDSGRAGAIGLVVMLGNTGGLIACWSYLSIHAPDYLPGNALNVGASAAIILMVAGLTFYLRNENKKRDNGERDQRLEGLPASEAELLGHNHPAFRYRY